MGGIVVWRDGAADGPTNMAADECLAAEAADRGGLIIRLYRWETTTVSIGAFQPIATARACAAIAGVPLVRRPSGGGAIVHGSDLTYAAAIPRQHLWGASPQPLYDAIHIAMAQTLRDWGIEARLAKPDPTAEAGFFCFDRRAGGDLVVDHGVAGKDERGVKLMGSAQRRLADAVLQHGSLLITENSDVGPAARHLSLGDVTAAKICGADGWPTFVEDWLERIAATLDQPIDPQRGSFVKSRAAKFQAAREFFSAPRWINRR